MSDMQLEFSTTAALHVQLVGPQLIGIDLEPAKALAAELEQSPIMSLEVRSPSALEAALLPMVLPIGGDAQPQNPVFSYTGGQLTGVLYSGGSQKTLAYASGRLSTVDVSLVGQTPYRKTMAYNQDGTLASVTRSAL